MLGKIWRHNSQNRIMGKNKCIIPSQSHEISMLLMYVAVTWQSNKSKNKTIEFFSFLAFPANFYLTPF